MKESNLCLCPCRCACSSSSSCACRPPPPPPPCPPVCSSCYPSCPASSVPSPLPPLKQPREEDDGFDRKRGEERDLRVPEEGEERRFLDFPSPPIVAVGGLVHRPSERRRAPGSFGEFSRSLVLGLNGYKAHVFLARQVGGSKRTVTQPSGRGRVRVAIVAVHSGSDGR